MSVWLFSTEIRRHAADLARTAPFRRSKADPLRVDQRLLQNKNLHFTLVLSGI
jgi:hypothetical protein